MDQHIESIIGDGTMSIKKIQELCDETLANGNIEKNLVTNLKLLIYNPNEMYDLGSSKVKLTDSFLRSNSSSIVDGIYYETRNFTKDRTDVLAISFVTFDFDFTIENPINYDSYTMDDVDTVIHKYIETIWELRATQSEEIANKYKQFRDDAYALIKNLLDTTITQILRTGIFIGTKDIFVENAKKMFYLTGYRFLSFYTKIIPNVVMFIKEHARYMNYISTIIVEMPMFMRANKTYDSEVLAHILTDQCKLMDFVICIMHALNDAMENVIYRQIDQSVIRSFKTNLAVFNVYDGLATAKLCTQNTEIKGDVAGLPEISDTSPALLN